MWALKLPRDQQRTKDLSPLSKSAVTSWPASATISAISRALRFTDQREPSRKSTTDCQSQAICRMSVNLLSFGFLQGFFFFFLSSIESLDYSEQAEVPSLVNVTYLRSTYTAPRVCSRLQRLPRNNAHILWLANPGFSITQLCAPPPVLQKNPRRI